MKINAMLLAAACAAAMAAPADAHTCTASAAPPSFTSPGVATGFGSHTCETPRNNISVTVCIEVATALNLWRSYGCQTSSTTNSPVAFGFASARVCSVSGGILMRTTAYGQTGAGQNDYDESLPVAYACAATR